MNDSNSQPASGRPIVNASTEAGSTPLPIIAAVSRLVTKITDRICGDRSDFPLLVACSAVEALHRYGIGANIFYGQAAWIEVMEDMSVMWAGCWGSNTHFWVVTQFGEVVDLNVSVSHRKKAHSDPNHRPKYSPPILWSKALPKFYRYLPEGLAEIELDSDRDKRWLTQFIREFQEKFVPMDVLSKISLEELDFPDEAILTPDRRILDDPGQTFQHYDRALMIQGIPQSPF